MKIRSDTPYKTYQPDESYTPQSPKQKAKYNSAAKRSKARRASAARAPSTKPLTPYSSNTPKVTTDGSKALTRTAKPMVATKKPAQARIRGEKTVGSYSKPGPNTSYKATSSISKAAGAGRGLLRAAGPVGAALAVGTTAISMAGPSGINAGGGQMKRSRKGVSNAPKASSGMAATEVKAAPSKATSPRSVANTVTGRNTTPTRSSSASAPTAPFTNQGAPVQEGPTRKPMKGRKANAGYDNYNRVMSAPGLAEGGLVRSSNPNEMTNLLGSGMAKQAATTIQKRKRTQQEQLNQIMQMGRRNRGSK